MNIYVCNVCEIVKIEIDILVIRWNKDNHWSEFGEQSR